MLRTATLFLAAWLFLLCAASHRAAQAELQQTGELVPLRTISPKMSLEQAVHEAIANSPVTKNSRLEIGMASDRITAVRSRFLPHTRFNAAGIQLITPLNFRFRKGSLGNDGVGGPIPDENVNVRDSQRPLLFLNASIVQPLLPVGTKIELQQNKLAKVMAYEKLKLDEQQVVNQVKHAYYQALQLDDSVQVVEASIQLYREVVRMTEEYLKLKAVPLADSLEAKQVLARAEYDRLRLKNGLVTAKERLNQMIGRDARFEFSLVRVSELDASDLDLRTAQSQALQNRLEVKQMSHQQTQVKLARRAVKAELIPDINLCMDYLSIFGTDNILPKNIVFAGVFANWEPIDWGRRKAQISEQHKRFKQMDNSLHDLQNQILLEVNDAHQRLEEAKMLLNVVDLGEQTARERLRVVLNKYKEKAALLKDVLQAQRDVYQADNQHTQAVLALWSARTDLEKALGEEVK